MKSIAKPGDKVECEPPNTWVVKEVKQCKVTKKYHYALSRSKGGIILKYVPEIEIDRVNGKKV